DGFTDGKVENAIRLSFDYFFLGNLSGLYFGAGMQQATYSVGHENTLERGGWETIDINTSVGYNLNVLLNIHLDARIALDATIYGEDDLLIGGYRWVPDKGGLFGTVGIGVHF
ncbi:MAG: hypothetical protein IID13_06870, partial [Candidatus Marinimicrobia bacterium]|nr:hypothetical protein [Candidatus Neomarinimicrobiota bacterium]